MRSILLLMLLTFTTFVQAQDYCLALRGNGELAPAHWGVMANLVEKMGLPVMQSGGSSASITLMLNEAIAGNKFILEVNDVDRRQRASLLYKSLEGLVDGLVRSPQWREFALLYGRTQILRAMEWSKDLEELLNKAAHRPNFLKENLRLLRDTYRTGQELGVISETNYAPLFKALQTLSEGDQTAFAKVQFYGSELREAIRFFDDFDPSSGNLFFRPGLVDFARFADQIGRVATFYSSLSNSASHDKQWRDFFTLCAPVSLGLTWSELISARPACGQRFNDLLQAVLFQTTLPSYADREMGGHLISFPTTAVLVNGANREARQALQDYHQKLDPQFGRQFFLSNSYEEVKFGYWGHPDDLKVIDANLPKGHDEKSRRFFPLGLATWKQILSLSPAEPGLASLQPFSVGAEDYVSAGGWSDLHPTTVLRAAGCGNVIYATRRGGESPFALGVAERLFAVKGNGRVALDILNQLYNLENPQSSMRRSLSLADVVLCTDWNRFKIQDGVTDLIRDSYRGSPFFVRNRSAFRGVPLLPQLNPRDVQPGGRLTYEGCF